MKSLLAVIDGLGFEASQLDPIQYIARITKGKVTIALLEHIPAVFPPLPPIVGDALYYNEEATNQHIRERQDRIRKNTEYLRAACNERKLDIELYTYTENMLEELLHASRFADLLLVRHGLIVSSEPAASPSQFVRKLLINAQCPVLIMPTEMQVIKEVSFAYNGSYSSIYAIRSFLQLFLPLASRKVVVMYVKDSGMESIPDELMLRKYLGLYSPKVEYRILKGDASKSIKVCLQYKKHSLVTFGAFGRSGLSRYFNESTAEDALDLMQTWVFVTHP